MQNKGLIRFFAITLALICLFYLSFSFATNRQENKAKELEANYIANNAGGDEDIVKKEAEAIKKAYLDSMATEKVWLGHTLRECRENQINLGLDLKGGMNVTLEISQEDILRSLAGSNVNNETLNKSIAIAKERMSQSNKDFLTLFEEAFVEVDPSARMAAIFSTVELKSKISANATNEEVMKVIREEAESAISNSFNVLRTRIDRFGVIQPNLQQLEGGRILIELPGVKEPERVRKLLQGSANLEFWPTFRMSEIQDNLIEANNIVTELLNAKEEEVTPTEVAPAEEVAEVDSLANALKEEVAETAKENEKSLFTYLIPNFGSGYDDATVGYAKSIDTAKVNELFALKQVKDVMPKNLLLRWTVKPNDEKSQIYRLVALKITTKNRKAPIEGDVITNAKYDFQPGSSFPIISMSMNREGSREWARLTKENINRQIAIVLDDMVYSYPNVQDEITGGNSQITGNFTLEEATDLANVLNSGKMPARARIIQEDVVGPSLGAQAIKTGIISLIVAFICILIYMFAWYGKIPGFVANIALISNVFFLLGILASFKAVLTLPGIAGIVLTMGMAVDANVLIYERTKEELRNGKKTQKALEDGYKNAFSAILDGNLTTLLTGIILFVFGTGPIKGFASTLIIGLITSFITAVFLSRLIFTSLLSKDKVGEISFSTKLSTNLWQNTSYNFVKARKVGYIIAAAMVLISIVSLSTRGLSQGIDFSGGRNYIVKFNQAVNTEDVASLLNGKFGTSAVSVIRIGSDDQVRISTNYKIDDNSESVDSEMESILYENLNSLCGNVDKDTFITNNIVNSQKVGPTIASDMKIDAIIAVLIAIICIGLYILIRFHHVSFSIGAYAALFHDTIIVLGFYSLFYGILPFSLEIDQTFIAAILTVLGYSVNDTVVVLDRVRENLKSFPGMDKKELINNSLNSTLARTFSTSLSTLVVLIIIAFFGSDTIKGFAVAMIIGVIIGTFSTLFVAIPIGYDIDNARKK
ncbi:MAG: protein translocase subunit SecDF [Paludibacteraceae bacterium]|nr:protein translocase subunit SecDF [Paludibacteraceae bacterium]